MAIPSDPKVREEMNKLALEELILQRGNEMMKALFGSSESIAEIVDSAVKKVAAINGEKVPEFTIAVSTASSPCVINQRGLYQWRVSDEQVLPQEYTMDGEYERFQTEGVLVSFFPSGWEVTASESKKMPKVEDLPPVFKREIDL